MVSKAKPILAEPLVGALTKNCGIRQILTFRGGGVPESLHRSPFSIVAALIPLAQQMAENKPSVYCRSPGNAEARRPKSTLQ